MTLRLYFRPLASFCHKALIALYENRTPFVPEIVDLADAKSAAAFKAVWPMGRFPVLRDEARNCFHDEYIEKPIQKIVTDRLRPDDARDAFGVEQARAQPALFYADTVEPFSESHPKLAPYLERLQSRPSFARVLAEAEPYFGLFPLEPKPRIARARAAGN